MEQVVPRDHCAGQVPTRRSDAPAAIEPMFCVLVRTALIGTLEVVAMWGSWTCGGSLWDRIEDWLVDAAQCMTGGRASQVTSPVAHQDATDSL
jgi:hypothetical protein